MAISSESFVKEIQEMVQKKHSKDHPVIGMIESGELSREGLKGFVGQFYLFFPKPFPKPIAAMLGRCPNDEVLEIDGLKVFVDAMSKDYLKEATVDYVESLQGSGFKIENPNSTASCGCGHSFSV